MRNALESYSEEKRKLIRVAAFAPAAYISKELCHSVMHYEAPAWRDLAATD